MVTILVVSPTVLYGDTWKHMIYNFKKEERGFPADVLMNSEGVANFAMNVILFCPQVEFSCLATR